MTPKTIKAVRNLWRYTFWHTLLGKMLAPLFFKPLICGQTCGCGLLTGCVGDSGVTGWSWRSWWTRYSYWRR